MHNISDITQWFFAFSAKNYAFALTLQKKSVHKLETITICGKVVDLDRTSNRYNPTQLVLSHDNSQTFFTFSCLQCSINTGQNICLEYVNSNWYPQPFILDAIIEKPNSTRFPKPKDARCNNN